MSTDTTSDHTVQPATDLAAASTTELIDLHLEAYGEPDPARRAALVAQVWAADGVLADPPFDATGRDGIADLTTIVLEHFPGHIFRRTTAVDEHHGIARYGWELIGPDGSVAVSGLDVADINDGRLQRVIGFFGEQERLDRPTS